MTFFKRLRNFIRCTFCRRKCVSRFCIGSRNYYSGFGFLEKTCPKDRENREYFAMQKATDEFMANARKEKND